MRKDQYIELKNFLKDSLLRGLKTDATLSIETHRALRDRPLLYVPGSDPEFNAITARVGDKADVLPLPDDFTTMDPHGLLWVPYPYVMAGPTRYREQFYWDSHFNIKGLLALGEVDLAQGMVGNFFYEVRHYGAGLNANRGWSLQVLRSQPPFLSSMVLNVADALTDPKARKNWLTESIPFLEKTYLFWRKERFSAETGLFHYDSTGPDRDTPCPELMRDKSRISTPKTHYEDALETMRDLPANNEDRRRFYDAEKDSLTGEFFRNDRAMREAGCDVSDRFGLFSGHTVEFDAVCLNSLLSKHCFDLAKIYLELGHEEKSEEWRRESSRISDLVNDYMWDEESGLYYDYNRKTRKISDWIYLTTAFPLFAGIATPERAKRVRDNIVNLFETDKTLRLSVIRTGKRWDDCDMLPYVDVAISGLNIYEFHEDALRIEAKRVRTLMESWLNNGVVPEKFDAETGEVDMSKILIASASYNDGDAKGGAAFAWNAANILWADKFFGRSIEDIICRDESLSNAS